MAINVTCPGCFAKFTVPEKYAGKEGPCPKCKAKITIPKLADQVVIHSPEHSEEGAVGVGGRHALKTYKKLDTKFKPLMFAAVAIVVLVTLLVAFLLRGTNSKDEMWVLALGAMVLGPPLAWAGYTFLRDDELEGYKGANLAIRSVACGLVYALLWGVYSFLGHQIFGAEAYTKGLEIWQLFALLVPMLAIGAGAAYVAFDLEIGSGFFHAALYFAVTVLLRLVIGLSVLPGMSALTRGRGR